MTLTEILKKATQEHWAVGHFNISNMEQLHGIINAAKNLRAPVMIGLSEGERDAFGLNQAVAVIESFKKETGLPIFVNSDHSKSPESAIKAFDAGFNSIHIDLSKLNYEENVAGTKKVADYVHAKNPDISVEGELGYLVTDSSKIYKEAVEIPEESLTKPEQAVEFVKTTGVNRFAGAYGNLHGISLKTEKKLDLERIMAIREALPVEVALVLHGGSGTNDEMFKRAIEAGIANIHISTEIRIAYSEALRKAMADMPEETTPYKFFPSVIKAVQDKVEERLRLFGSVNRA